MSKKKRKMSEEELQNKKEMLAFHLRLVSIPFEELSKRLRSRAVAFGLLKDSYSILDRYDYLLDVEVPEVPEDLERIEYRTVVVSSGENKREVDRYDLLSLVTMHSEEELMEYFGYKTKESLKDMLEKADDLLYIY